MTEINFQAFFNLEPGLRAWEKRANPWRNDHENTIHPDHRTRRRRHFRRLPLGPIHDDGFISLFDGNSLKGWHVSAKTGHSRASKNQSGGLWVVENGAIIAARIFR